MKFVGSTLLLGCAFRMLYSLMWSCVWLTYVISTVMVCKLFFMNLMCFGPLNFNIVSNWCGIWLPLHFNAFIRQTYQIFSQKKSGLSSYNCQPVNRFILLSNLTTTTTRDLVGFSNSSPTTQWFGGDQTSMIKHIESIFF